MPPKLIVDLKTRTLTDDHDVIMIRPGHSYHLYGQTAITQSIAPDVPFLTVKSGIKPDQAPDFKAQILRARAFRKWDASPKEGREKPPSKDLERYSTFQAATAATTKLSAAANSILWDIPESTLVFIPGWSLAANAMTAEMGSPTARRLRQRVNREGTTFTYPARALKGLSMTPMRDFPAEVTDYAKNRISFHVYTGYARERILRAHYGDYQIGENVAVMRYKSEAEMFDIGAANKIISLATIVERFNSTGEAVALSSAASLPSTRGEVEIHANINSPDGILQIQSRSVTAHVVRSLILIAVLGLAGKELYDLASSHSIVLENTSECSGADIVPATSNSLVDFVLQSGADGCDEIMRNVRLGVLESEGRVHGSATLHR